MRILSWAFLLATGFITNACSPTGSREKDDLRNYCSENRIRNQFITQWSDLTTSLVETNDLKNFLFMHQGKIKFIEPNYRLAQQSPDPGSPEIPEDPIPQPPVPEQPHIPPPEFYWNSGYILEEMGVQRAWDRNYKGQNVTVAVIDSGIDIHLSELRNNIFFNFNESLNQIDDDGNGFIDDQQGWNFSNNSRKVVDEIGHGTAIAGIISGRNLGSQSLGIAPEALILPLDIMSSSSGTEYDAKRAIDYAINMKAQIINNSWSSSCSQYLASAFAEYKNANVIFVNSAGNNPLDVYENKVMLASLEFANFLNVGSTDLFGAKSNFSGYGRSINIWAPGEKIPVLTLSLNSDIATKASGTSVSAAIVSGATALVWSAYPGKSAVEIVKRLQDRAIHRNGRNFISIDRALP